MRYQGEDRFAAVVCVVGRSVAVVSPFQSVWPSEAVLRLIEDGSLHEEVDCRCGHCSVAAVVGVGVGVDFGVAAVNSCEV